MSMTADEQIAALTEMMLSLRRENIRTLALIHAIQEAVAGLIEPAHLPAWQTELDRRFRAQLQTFLEAFEAENPAVAALLDDRQPEKVPTAILKDESALLAGVVGDSVQIFLPLTKPLASKGEWQKAHRLHLPLTKHRQPQTRRRISTWGAPPQRRIFILVCSAPSLDSSGPSSPLSFG